MWRKAAVATAQGIGASLSGLAAGVIVDHFGYSAAFLTSAAVAAIAFARSAAGDAGNGASRRDDAGSRRAGARNRFGLAGRDRAE